MVHSLTAKMSYPDIIGNTPVEEIKIKFHKYIQEAKGIELKKNNSSTVTGLIPFIVYQTLFLIVRQSLILCLLLLEREVLIY